MAVKGQTFKTPSFGGLSEVKTMLNYQELPFAGSSFFAKIKKNELIQM